MPAAASIGIFYHADPLGHVPSGIDSLIRSTLKWAPDDLHYTLYGATSDLEKRPIGKALTLEFGSRGAQFIPIVYSNPTAVRHKIPLTVRYIWALRAHLRSREFSRLQVLDFHRLEPLVLFRRDARPMNVTIHNDMAVLRDTNCDMAWRHMPWLYEYLEGRSFAQLDRVFVVRQSAIDRYRATYSEFAERFVFLPTAVDTGVFGPSRDASERQLLRQKLDEACGASEPRRFLIFVGRLDSQKDPLLLLSSFQIAAQKDPALHLIIIGDGSLRGAVEAARIEKGLGLRVTLLGSKRPSEIADILRAGDAFVLSSAYEGMPIAVLEALACGLPVISTNVGEIGRVVTNRINGRICEERTAGALSEAILLALAETEAMRGRPCTESILAHHPERAFGAIYENHRRQAQAFAKL